MTGYDQQIPASHWSMSAILASDWLLDMTQPAYTTDIKMGRAGKRERGKNWEDFGAKTKCTSCSTRQLPHTQGRAVFWIEPFVRWETEDWETLNCVGWCNNPSSAAWRGTGVIAIQRGVRDHQHPWQCTLLPGETNQRPVFLGIDQSEDKEQPDQHVLMMYFDTGGDIIPETSSQYIADHWKSDQFCTELGNNTQKTRVQQHVHALLRRPRGLSDIPEFKIGLSNFVLDF